PPDQRRADPGRRAQVPRGRQLRARAVRSGGSSEVTPGVRRPAVLGLGGLLAAGVLTAPSAAVAQLRHEQLDNGLTVIVRENPVAPVVAVSLLVKMGTRWEHPATAGIANFVHAVMVKGTAKRSGAELAAIVAAYRAGYRPERMVLAVSGQVAASEVLAEARRRFGGMARAGAGVDPPVPAPIASAGRIELEMPAQQSQILTGSLAPGLDHPDHAAVKVLSTILGGGMAGRLFAELRDKQGLAYTATSYYDPVREP